MSDEPHLTAVVPRPAATALILRDRPHGIEVFMVVRHHQIEFAAGALVFPGGQVDGDDADPDWDGLTATIAVKRVPAERVPVPLDHERAALRAVRDGDLDRTDGHG